MGRDTRAPIMVTCPHCSQKGLAELSAPADQGDVIGWALRVNQHEYDCPWIIKQGDVFTRHPLPRSMPDGYMV